MFVACELPVLRTPTVAFNIVIRLVSQACVFVINLLLTFFVDQLPFCVACKCNYINFLKCYSIITEND